MSVDFSTARKPIIALAKRRTNWKIRSKFINQNVGVRIFLFASFAACNSWKQLYFYNGPPLMPCKIGLYDHRWLLKIDGGKTYRSHSRNLSALTDTLWQGSEKLYFDWLLKSLVLNYGTGQSNFILSKFMYFFIFLMDKTISSRLFTNYIWFI